MAKEKHEVEVVITGNAAPVDAEIAKVERKRPKVKVDIEAQGGASLAGETRRHSVRDPATGRFAPAPATAIVPPPPSQPRPTAAPNIAALQQAAALAQQRYSQLFTSSYGSPEYFAADQARLQAARALAEAQRRSAPPTTPTTSGAGGVPPIVPPVATGGLGDWDPNDPHALQRRIAQRRADLMAEAKRRADAAAVAAGRQPGQGVLPSSTPTQTRSMITSGPQFDQMQEAVNQAAALGRKRARDQLYANAQGLGYGVTMPPLPEEREAELRDRRRARARRAAVQEHLAGGNVRGYSDIPMDLYTRGPGGTYPLFNYGVSPRGEAAISRTTPGVGAKTEADIDRLVRAIQDQAKAHDQAAKAAAKTAREMEREGARLSREQSRAADALSRAAAQADREARRQVRSQARQEADQFQDRIADLSPGRRAIAVRQRMQALAAGGAPQYGDPGYREYRSLAGQARGLRGQSMGPIPFGPNSNIIPGSIWMQSLFGGWEVARAASAVRLGEVQGSLALTPHEGLEARLAGLRMASSGFISGPLSELGNVIGRVSGFESFEKLERDVLTERSRRTDQDFFQDTMGMIRVGQGSRQAYAHGGAGAASIAQVRAQSESQKLLITRQIGDTKFQLGERKIGMLYSQAEVDRAKAQLNKNGNQPVKMGQGEVRYNSQTGLLETTGGEAIETFALSGEARSDRNLRLAALERQLEELPAATEHQVGIIQRQQGLELMTRRTEAGIWANTKLSPRQRTRLLARNQIDREVAQYEELHGSAAGAEFRKMRTAQQLRTEEVEDRSRNAMIEGFESQARASRLRGGGFTFEAGLASIWGDTNTRMGMTQSEDQRAAILQMGLAQMGEQWRTATRGAAQGRRRNAAAVASATARHHGDDLSASLIEMGEAQASELDQAGQGLFASFFMRPSIRLKYATLGNITRQEDSRNHGFRMQSMRDQVAAAELEAVGKPGQAMAQNIRQQTEMQVSGIRSGARDREEQRSLILRGGIARLRQMEREFHFEDLQGEFVQMTGGTFAPTASSTRPWEEDRAARLKATREERETLERQLAGAPTPSPVGNAVDPNAHVQALQQAATDMATAVKELVTLIRG